ncbi:MAG: hypothetical protein ACRDMV_01550 [Streptosporangiales bacterium]
MTTPPGDPNAGGYPPPPGPGSYGYGAPRPQSNAPMVLGIIGLVCIVLCWPAGILLGLVGQSKARQYGQSDTLPKIAWIVSIVAGVFSILANIVIRLG